MQSDTPQTTQKKILLTGANGYIGKRLLPLLVEYDYKVVCMVRDPRRFNVPERIKEKVDIIKADLLNRESLDNIPSDIDAAFYLAHSMSTTYKDFEELEAKGAQNFRDRMEQTRCQQVIFLSGIINDREELSRHMRSRKNVEDILIKSSVPATVLRAAVIVGSGSASFEIMRDLVEKLPVMIAPKWLMHKVQPIAIRDVLQYLTGVMFKEAAYEKVFDIGGPDVLTYRDMLNEFAKVRGLRRYFINVPVLTPKLSSYWLYFVTSTSFSLARSLVESLKHNLVCGIEGIDEIVKVEKIPYKEAVKLAFSRIEQNLVMSSWIDSVTSGTAKDYILDFVEVPQNGTLTDRQLIPIRQNPEEVLDNVWSIGGDRGWYYANFLWKMRGFLDKLFGGVGLRRGRRSPTEIAPGDSLDFWRVLVANREKRYLLLYAEMKLPGEAWLEMQIIEKGGNLYFQQTATYRPKGLLGRLYWYALLPFHYFIFRGMAERIVSTVKISHRLTHR